jgi:hypothetical protein
VLDRNAIALVNSSPLLGYGHDFLWKDEYSCWNVTGNCGALFRHGYEIERRVLSLVNGRMLKWSATRAMLIDLKLDPSIQATAMLRNSFVFNQRTPFFAVLIRMRGLLESKIRQGRNWEGAMIMEEMLPPLAEVIGLVCAMRLKDLLG